jgi:hypothetical protein
MARDPDAIGGSRGGEFHLGGDAWRHDLQQRAQRLAEFSEGVEGAAEVETGIILVDSGSGRARQPRKNAAMADAAANGGAWDYMPDSLALPA